ncbi:MAG: PQQ-binding-like beta-propeller repeat protein [Planctomycetes bacterium]|nr:PQQ-binding-like beta-propeller repeat protein [Planctomycetota bacterium]MBU1518313.1 PQQ-binding-like beta-propeller repeat protein [Planctomycetota bacterium]MBU2457860.1 PQQ-binding-like beta-propeller repeat protein [Planctomycetota bacterium]
MQQGSHTDRNNISAIDIATGKVIWLCAVIRT